MELQAIAGIERPPTLGSRGKGGGRGTGVRTSKGGKGKRPMQDHSKKTTISRRNQMGVEDSLGVSDLKQSRSHEARTTSQSINSNRLTKLTNRGSGSGHWSSMRRSRPAAGGRSEKTRSRDEELEARFKELEREVRDTLTLSQQQPQQGQQGPGAGQQGRENIGANGFLIAEQQEREEALQAKEALVELRAAEVARRERDASTAKANEAASKKGKGDPEFELERAQMKIYKLELQLREALAGGGAASVYASAAGVKVDCPAAEGPGAAGGSGAGGGGVLGGGGGGSGGIVLGGGGGGFAGGDGMVYMEPQELLALEQELVVQEQILKGTQKENERLTAQLKQAHTERRIAEDSLGKENENVSKRLNEELEKVSGVCPLRACLCVPSACRLCAVCVPSVCCLCVLCVLCFGFMVCMPRCMHDMVCMPQYARRSTIHVLTRALPIISWSSSKLRAYSLTMRAVTTLNRRWRSFNPSCRRCGHGRRSARLSWTGCRRRSRRWSTSLATARVKRTWRRWTHL
jgi:hypothetical protein